MSQVTVGSAIDDVGATFLLEADPGEKNGFRAIAQACRLPLSVKRIKATKRRPAGMLCDVWSRPTSTPAVVRVKRNKQLAAIRMPRGKVPMPGWTRSSASLG